jgi:chemotaxis signal transduction protein
MGRALVPLQFEGVWIALDASCVQEILGEQPWVRIPGAPAQVPGVAGWRGRAVAVLDLGVVGGLGSFLKPGERRPRTVVVRSGGCTLAVPVDVVREVQEVPEDRLTAPKTTQLPFASSEVELHGVPMPVLDWAAVVEAISRTARAA